MTAAPLDLLFYAGALFVLFLTPGPVWVALMARALAGGFRSAWPLALGVVVGDVIWPLIAILGVSWVVSEFNGFMDVLRWVACGMCVIMGILLIRNADKSLGSDSRLTRPGMWVGFVAGIIVILSNPKAVLFYMGVLPGFFDLTQVTGWDISAICFLSLVVPLTGNLILAVFVDRARRVLTTSGALRRVNIVSGSLLVLVGLLIALT